MTVEISRLPPNGSESISILSNAFGLLSRDKIGPDNDVTVDRDVVKFVEPIFGIVEGQVLIVIFISYWGFDLSADVTSIGSLIVGTRSVVLL